MNEKNPETQIVALILYVLMSIFIWFPIGYLMSLVNLKVTIVIFLMYFIREVSRIYLGIKLV